MTKRLHSKTRKLILECAIHMSIEEQNAYLKMCTNYLETEGNWSKNKIHTELGVSMQFLKSTKVKYANSREDELIMLIGKVYNVIIEEGLEP